ncbi:MULTISPECIES: hypothetical protein [Cronobacter]|uniref:hypothetical protein n=1 Tax=Cronobacter TaxID=413496 RepID=UPI00131A0A5E|nr:MULTISPECIES: hypothetical protein [Cronobacter]EKM0439610.1 hypothetical protein [Cronobacter turicensis]WRU16745.1 hypothetical protein U9L39_21670 [Cronobacter malonaticus]
MNNRHGIPDHLFAPNLGDIRVSDTVVYQLGEMLSELETRYGPRDPSWTFVGVAFSNEGPMHFFPGSSQTPRPKNVMILLSAGSFINYKCAMFELSHECVHLLAPSGGRHAPVMEEGLAYRYSREILARNFGHPLEKPYGEAGAYEAAGRSVEKLLQHDSEAIRKLREVQPAFYNMTPATFMEAGLQVPADLIAELLKPFYQG